MIDIREVTKSKDTTNNSRVFLTDYGKVSITFGKECVGRIYDKNGISERVWDYVFRCIDNYIAIENINYSYKNCVCKKCKTVLKSFTAYDNHIDECYPDKNRTELKIWECNNQNLTEEEKLKIDNMKKEKGIDCNKIVCVLISEDAGCGGNIEILSVHKDYYEAELTYMQERIKEIEHTIEEYGDYQYQKDEECD